MKLLLFQISIVGFLGLLDKVVFGDEGEDCVEEKVIDLYYIKLQKFYRKYQIKDLVSLVPERQNNCQNHQR